MSKGCAMKKKYDVYVAGPFFNNSQLAEMASIEAEFSNIGLSMFRPRLDSVNLSEDNSPEARKKAFEDDVSAIEQSRFIFANTRDKDPGTLFEVGYAYKAGVPIVGFASGLPKGAPFNIMLAGAMVEVFTSIYELQDFIDMFDSTEDMLEHVAEKAPGSYTGTVQ